MHCRPLASAPQVRQARGHIELCSKFVSCGKFSGARGALLSSAASRVSGLPLSDALGEFKLRTPTCQAEDVVTLSSRWLPFIVESTQEYPRAPVQQNLKQLHAYIMCNTSGLSERKEHTCSCRASEGSSAASGRSS